MAITEEVRLLVKSEVGKAVNDINKLNKSMSTTNTTAKKQQSTLSSLRAGWLAAGAAIFKVGQFMMSAVKAASDLEEQQSKFNTVFKDSAETMKIAQKGVDDLTQSYSMSTREAMEHMASIQDMLKPMGIVPEEAARMSQQIVKLAADMGSFNNLPTAKVMEDIKSSLVGMNRPMLKYGTVINANMIKQLNSNKAVDAATRARLTLTKIIETQKDAIGDIGRTQNSYANQVKRTSANLEDFKAGVGEELKNSLTTLMSTLNQSGISFKNFGTTIGKVAVGIIPIIGGMTRLKRAHDDYVKKKANEQLVGSNFVKIARSIKKATKNLKKIKTTSNNTWKSIVKDQRSATESLLGTDDQFQKRRNDLQKLYDSSLRGRRVSQKKQEDLMIAFHQKMKAIDDDETAHKTKNREKEWQDRLKTANNIISHVSGFHSQINSIATQAMTNQSMALENQQAQDKERFDEDQATRLEAWQLEYESQRQLIENEVSDQAEKSARLQALEMKDEQFRQKLEKEKEAFDTKQDKERRALARKQAKIGKSLAITSAVINTAQAVTRALASPIPGMPWNIAMATAVGGLGAAQIGLIAAQPLPQAADGGIIQGTPGGTALIAGEGGRSEAILPLENDRALEQLGGIGTTVNVYIENAFGSDDLSDQFKNAIDRAMFELDQDGNSIFADRVRTT